MKKPSALKPGDLIALVAPSGYVDRSKIPPIEMFFKMRGYRVRRYGDVRAEFKPLANSDDHRLNHLIAALSDPAVAMVFCVRGGYGTIRLVDSLLKKLPRRLKPKIFSGFSDITLLHLLFQKRLRWISFHAPMGGAIRAGHSALKLMMEIVQGSRRELCSARFAAGFKAYRRDARLLIGEAIGGNLSLLQASIGTAFEPETEGKILFLEDIDEPLYRIERMLLHLKLAGKLDHLKGFVLGRLTHCPGKGFNLEQVIDRVFRDRNYSVLYHYPFSHGKKNITLPIGCRVSLDTRSGALWLLESAVS